jgi:aminocarboxymuconate-semialdehyde decarboxylase
VPPDAKTTMRIDVHNHVIPELALDHMKRDPAYKMELRGTKITLGGHVPFELTRDFVEPAAKLVALEKEGVGGAVVSVAPPLFYYHLEPAAAETICNVANTGLSEFCAAAPERLRWMAHVPMGSPEKAVETLKEARMKGCVGVEVGTSIAGKRLDDESMEPFWTEVERLNLPVFIHPAYNEHSEGLDPFYLQNVIGNQLETTIAVERLICAGVLDRHPSLVLLLAHGGGYFPYQAGRLRHAISVRPELAAVQPDPWRYLRQLRFDCITHDTAAAAYLVARVGPDRVVLGSDSPFDMGLTRPYDFLYEAVGAKTAERIASDNSAGLFGPIR